MPIYEYVCTQCRHEFEALVRNSSSSPEDGCPKCHSTKLKRKLSTFSASVSRGGCAHESVCPNASPACGCGCGCGGHHHH